MTILWKGVSFFLNLNKKELDAIVQKTGLCPGALQWRAHWSAKPKALSA